MQNFDDFTKQEPMFVIKVKNKELYLNTRKFGLPGSETSYHAILKYPEIFSSRSDCKETLLYYTSNYGKIVNDIDDSTVYDLEIKKIKII